MIPDSIRILLVEDDEDDAVLTTALLRDIDSAQFTIKWTADFETGLRELRQGHDVCLVDYRLGERNGIEFMQSATKLDCQIPIILLTGQGDRDVDLAAMRAGAADFLSKTQISASLLERSIRYSIQQKRSERQRLQFVQEQIARREAEAANRAKDSFLATLSHELRTPLNSILGWAQLLRAGGLDEETQSEAVESIERNAKAQAQLIEDLLDVSRIITGKVRLERKPVNVQDVIAAAIDVVRPEARAKEIDVRREVEPDVDPIVGDATRLQQVVWNLLTNALKFTPAGGRVIVSLAQGQDEVHLTVTDTGQGIDPAFLPHVFDRFRQADSSTTRKYTGLGLGLAIVRHIAELHGGRVRAESEGEGKGASFIVSLPRSAPRTDPSPDTRRSDGEASLRIEPQLSGVRVLLVDDEADARAFVSKALSLSGAVVTTVASAAAAFEEFVRARPDVIVSDIAMPGEDGYSLIRRIQARACGAGDRVPAVAITAHAGEQDRQRALESGFQAYLAKPIEPVRLVRAIADVIQSIASRRPIGSA